MFTNSSDLCDYHFNVWSEPKHINRTGLTHALRKLQNLPALIVETGTSAWGCDSSRLFASYVENFGGTFWSVDTRIEASQKLGNLGPKANFVVDDSVNFLSKFIIPQPFDFISLTYLDSFDLDVNNPEPSMEHGLNEWHALLPHLAPGSVVVIDDTPIEYFLLGSPSKDSNRDSQTIPGKGSLILKDAFFLKHFEILYHHYNLVIRWI